MWESRVLGEISKSLWEPLFGFHRDVISIAVFVVAPVRETEIRGCCPLTDVPIAVPGASYAVVSDPSRCRIAHAPLTAAPFGPSGTLTLLSPPHTRPPASDT